MDRGKAGGKRHLIVDRRRGAPLVVHTTAANVRDEAPVPGLLAKLADVPLARRPREFYADRGYGFAWTIGQVREAGMEPRIPPRGSPHGSGLGKVRWVVEAAMAWFNNFRRLRLCYERTAAIWQALHELAAAMICLKKLVHHVAF